MPRKGAAFDDRVYPRNVLVYSSFFAPGGGGVHRWSSIERRWGIAAARSGPQDPPAGASWGNLRAKIARQVLQLSSTTHAVPHTHAQPALGAQYLKKSVRVRYAG